MIKKNIISNKEKDEKFNELSNLNIYRIIMIFIKMKQVKLEFIKKKINKMKRK